ncbi:patatin-like phospholipase family protein [Erythrobacter sp. SDW2]|uniref:patatin-like phospholipase family protein n=1 Tax=Erythrobacter sp. SDW2 TaxID=2907154 RepID=UPI001F2451F0|nr:patatin-like phospholipase family protein [Erythrobacter sp. SDW2]UIP07799.1 patatin-like phospholipase family protein [Erythrobacter sp. SDW2]
MQARFVAGALALGAMLAGCSINQKAPLTAQGDMCNFVTHKLAVAIPEDREGIDSPLSPFAQAIEQSLAAHDTGVERGEEAQVLFLSGGSEHGAYGAGILSGWGGDGDIPDLQVVTGVSTGSILSTFAFVDKGDFAADGYTIDSESQLLNVYSKPKNGQPDVGNFIDLLKKGAFADLEPLKTRLEGYLTQSYQTTGPTGVIITTTALAEVAKRHAEGRRLYVGAVDADSGDGVAFDMGDMAARTIANQNGKAAHWLDCYIDAIVASSSTPMAAPPVFIDNTMYIDGGVRFGLFGDSVIEAFKARKEAARNDDNAPTPPRVYAVIDGTLTLPPNVCPKENPADCSGDPPTWTSAGQHKDWNILQLALRSERLLVNQVYRFSAASVEAEACEDAGCFNFLRIEPDVAQFGITLPAPLNAGNTGQLTCAQWIAVDIAQDNPIQFHKRYMRCLIAYGQVKVAAAGWGS